MAGLRGFYEKLKYIVGGDSFVEHTLQSSQPSVKDVEGIDYKKAGQEILSTANERREAQRLALKKAMEEKRRVAQAKRAIDQAQVTSEPVIPESQIEFGTLQPGTGQRLREAEKAGVSPRTLAALFDARRNSQKK